MKTVKLYIFETREVLTDDTMIRFERLITCPYCLGSGEVYEESGDAMVVTPCIGCERTGKVWMTGDERDCAVRYLQSRGFRVELVRFDTYNHYRMEVAQ